MIFVKEALRLALFVTAAVSVWAAGSAPTALELDVEDCGLDGSLGIGLGILKAQVTSNR